MMNRSGPSTELCGTPDDTGKILVDETFTQTYLECEELEIICKPSEDLQASYIFELFVAEACVELYQMFYCSLLNRKVEIHAGR